LLIAALEWLRGHSNVNDEMKEMIAEREVTKKIKKVTTFWNIIIIN